MTKHYIDIVGKWAFVIAYDIREKDLGEIGDWLDALGAEKADIYKAQDVLTGLNAGLTYSSPRQRMSIVCIGNATSEEQWWNTLVHEIEHLKNAIGNYYGVEKGSEEEAYLIGYVMQRIVRNFKS